MQGRPNAGVRPSATRGADPCLAARARERRLEGRAGATAVPLALCVALALAGCGSDDDDEPPEDDPSSVATPTIDAEAQEPVGPAEPIPPVGAGEPDEPVGSDEPLAPIAIFQPDGPEPDEPEPEPDPDGDDVPGLVVNGLDGLDPADVVSPWLLNATFFRLDSNTPGSGDAGVGLVRYDDDFPVGAHVNFYSKELDTCRLNRTDDAGDDPGDADPDDAPPPLVGGGPSITINTPAGPWFVLDGEAFGEDGTQTRYATNNGLPGPLPADATLSVPGDVFPNVAAFELPDEPAVPIRLMPDEGERLGLDTIYTWVPGRGGDHITLQFIALDAATGDFVDSPVFCTVVDDGRFAPPDDVRTFLATTTDEVLLRYARVRDVLTLRDGIVFRARTIVAE